MQDFNTPISAEQFLTAIKEVLELKALNRHKKTVLSYVKESPVTKFLIENKEAVVLVGLVIAIIVSVLAFFIIKCLLKCKNPKFIKVM